LGCSLRNGGYAGRRESPGWSLRITAWVCARSRARAGILLDAFGLHPYGSIFDNFIGRGKRAKRWESDL
jgi:hypothetical protein